MEFSATVSIHAPREGCDQPMISSEVFPSVFQFTHPGRGATSLHSSGQCSPRCFNSRTPGGVRLDGARLLLFASTVSIHAPREGCDGHRLSTPLGVPCFNSRTPGGVRLLNPIQISISDKFQFTHPGRGATQQTAFGRRIYDVSIHAPREGCDYPQLEQAIGALKFQFTHPGRGATPMRR